MYLFSFIWLGWGVLGPGIELSLLLQRCVQTAVCRLSRWIQRTHDLLQPLQLRVQLMPQRFQLTLPLLVLPADGLQGGAHARQVCPQQPPGGIHSAILIADLGESAMSGPGGFVLLFVPGFFVVINGKQCFQVTLQGMVGSRHLCHFSLHQTEVFHHSGESFKAGVGVVGDHAGVGLDVVFLETLGLQLLSFPLSVWGGALRRAPTGLQTQGWRNTESEVASNWEHHNTRSGDSPVDVVL